MRDGKLNRAQRRFDKMLIDKGIRSHREFADRVGMDETMFSGVFNGHRKFPEKHLAAAVKVLGETPEFTEAILDFKNQTK